MSVEQAHSVMHDATRRSAWRQLRIWPGLRQVAQRATAMLRATLQFLTFFGLAMIAVVWIGVEHNLSIRHQAARRSAEQNVGNLSLIFEEHVSRAIREADKRLLLLRAAYENAPDGEFDLRAWVGNALFRSDLDVQYALIGPDGVMLASNVGPAKARVDLSDREHFRVHLGSEKDDLFISKPVLGRASGKWSIQLTRRVRDKSGGFGGVLVSSLDPYHLARLYESVDLGRDGAITLVGLDGVIRARGGMSADVLGRSMAKSAIFSLYKSHPSGLLVGTGVVDGVRRLLSYRVVPDFPLIVVAAMSENEIFAEFEREKNLYRLAGTALSIIIGVFIFAGVQNRLRLDATLVALAAERDVAQHASAAKSSFLAMMSHEIRTPMNAMLGLTSSLLEGELTSDQRASLQTIQQAGDSLLELLNDILDYSKLEAGELSLEDLAFAPAEVALGVISVIGPRAEAKGLAITSTSAPGLPPGLLGDAGRLRQVLLNLVSNAVKFTSEGSVAVTCHCISRTETHAVVEWVVSDTGIGIGPDQISKLFHDYVQADSSISRRYGGTGLGLSICKRILDRMGGSIEASSVLGQGTTMRCRVELPVAEVVEEKAEHEDFQARLHARIADLGRPLRLLIVDDNATNRLVAAKMLQEFDILVAMAADGAEAVATAMETDFDVILMDMQMPEMDGLAASRAIRARGRTLPIIAFTANAFEDDKAACRAAGMNGFVAKPVRKPALVTAVTQAIAHGNAVAARQESPARSAPLPPPRHEAGEGGSVVDRREFDELADMLGEAGMREAMASFMEETSTRLAALRAYRLDDERDKIKREAHTLKGSASTFGFRRLSELARWLEQHAAEVDATTLDEVAGRMEKAFADARLNVTPAPLAA